MVEGLYDVYDRLARLDASGDILPKLKEAINWEMFRPICDAARAKERRHAAGRKPYDSILLFKMLILQQLYNLSDEALEKQVLDRISFMRFLDMKFKDNVPDRTTIWNFKQELVKNDSLRKIFGMFDEELTRKGITAQRGTIIDATIIDAPKRKTDKEEEESARRGEKPADWKEEKSRQVDTDAQWTKKNDHAYFGYKNHVCVDVENKLIRKYAVTDASVHDGRVFIELLDYTNTNRDVYADAAYPSQKNLDMLDAMGFRDKVHRRAYRNRPLTDSQKASNRRKSEIRSRIEHVFGMQRMMLGDQFLRCIGIARARCAIGLRNLVYNMRRSLFLVPDMT